MKKSWIAIFIAFGLILGGCSLVEEASDTVNYVSEATNYMNEVNDFVNEAPTIASEAVTDEQSLIEFDTRLNDMKEAIQSFNDVQPPEIAADLHQQILDYNQRAEEGIDLYLENIKDGKLDPELLENTEVFQTFEDISNIVEDIKQLGQ
jgi:Family of unknown function (DUF6376)